MREVVTDTRWGRNHLLQNAAYVAVGAAGVAATLLGIISLPAGGTLVVTAASVGVVIDAWRFTHYQCGRCRRRLPAPRKWWVVGGRGRTTFACDHCGVLWQTALSQEA